LNLEASIVYVMTKQVVLELVVANACHVHKNNSRPKEVAKMAPWVMLLAISC
jgi:hypothetical protein